MNSNKNNKGKSSGKRNFNSKRNSSFNRNNYSFDDREMHDAVCSKCGKECKVPFKPIEGKSVFCKECYSKKKKF